MQNFQQSNYRRNCSQIGGFCVREFRGMYFSALSITGELITRDNVGLNKQRKTISSV